MKLDYKEKIKKPMKNKMLVIFLEQEKPRNSHTLCNIFILTSLMRSWIVGNAVCCFTSFTSKYFDLTNLTNLTVVMSRK